MTAGESRARDLFARVRRLQIRCSGLIDQELAGSYDSAFKGQGNEFEETRPYALGDDVRAIDWRVTARAGRPFVKLFREERQLTIHLAVDVSGSLQGPRSSGTPRQVVDEVAAVFALLAAREQDRVGLLLFTDQVEMAIRPAGGAKHATRLVRELLSCEPGSTRTDLNPPLVRLCRVERRRCVVIILSDFLSSEFDSSLRVANALHDVIPVVVHDPVESELPKCGLLHVRDPETGRLMLIDTSSRMQRDRYRAAHERAVEQRDRLFSRLRLTPLKLDIRDDVAVQLHRFFDRRSRGVRS